MKIWKGKEQEGKDKGVLTLFICSLSADISCYNTICTLCKEQRIKRIYLGAGKVNADISKELVRMLTNNGYQVVIETSSIKDAEQYSAYNVEVILRTCLNASLHNISPKLDNDKEVRVYYNAEINSLESVKNAMYENEDVVLWEN